MSKYPIYRLKIKKVYDENNRRHMVISNIALLDTKELAMAYAHKYVAEFKHHIKELNGGNIPERYHFADIDSINLNSRNVGPLIKEDNYNPNSRSSILWYLYIDEEWVHCDTDFFTEDKHFKSLI